MSTPHAPPKRKREEPDKGFNTKQKSQDTKGKGPSRWKTPRKNPPKNKKVDTKDEHTDWKAAHEVIKDDVVDKRKKEKRCTRCNMDNHTWRKCRKPILVATTFAYKNRSSQTFRKPRTSTLAVHNPPPRRSEPPAKVARVERTQPTRVWELSDKKQS